MLVEALLMKIYSLKILIIIYLFLCILFLNSQSSTLFSFDKKIPSILSEKCSLYMDKQLEFGYRVPGSSAHLKCRDFIVNTLKTNGLKVKLQTFTASHGNARGIKMHNIIADVKKNPMFMTYGTIILGSHYDTRPTACKEREFKKRSLPIMGANDGASSTAVLMALSHILEDIDTPFNIRLLFTDGEDYGPTSKSMFYGAYHYADNMTEYEKNKTTAVIFLDMIGDADLNVYKDIYSENAAPFLNRFIFNTAIDLGFDDCFFPWTKYSILDDHVAFIKQGIRAVDIIDFDYPYWHKLEDTKDKVSTESMEKVSLLMYTVLEKFKIYYDKIQDNTLKF